MAERKGSKKNPYNFTEYNLLIQNYQWEEGWVEYVDDKLYYINSNHDKYLGSDYGKREHPFPEDIYSGMRLYGFWSGGYTYRGQELVYITKGGYRYYESTGIFGSIDEPCPMEIFLDMCENRFWKGGWVEDEYGNAQYTRNLNYSNEIPGTGSSSNSSSSGSSSSGSGSTQNGCGCGCSSNHGTDRDDDVIMKAGNIYYGTFLNGEGKIKITWTEGKPFTMPLSAVYATVELESTSATLVGHNLSAYWDQAFFIAVTGTIRIKSNDTPPQTYYILLPMERIMIPETYKKIINS